MSILKRTPLTSERHPRVSVVLPTYNRAGLLARAIDSVLGQTFKSYELIVVDDGSTDHTQHLLAAYAGRLTILRQPNRGVSTARNRGITAASGDLIALLDSDDYWLPRKLERQAAFFDDHPDALICQTEELWIRNGVRVNPGRRHAKTGGMIFEKSLPLCMVSPSAVMFRRTLLDEVGLFDESLPACEDYDLWLRITWKYPVHLIQEALTVKRGGHDDQLSRMPELDRLRIRALVKILRQGCLSMPQKAAALAALEEKCRIYAGGCLKRGRQAEADHYLALSEHFE